MNRIDNDNEHEPKKLQDLNIEYYLKKYFTFTSATFFNNLHDLKPL